MEKITRKFINYKLEKKEKSSEIENQLRNIIKKNISSQETINYLFFYQNRKLRNLLIRNQPVKPYSDENSYGP